MPHVVRNASSAQPEAAPVGIGGQNPTTTREFETNGATVTLNRATAAEAPSSVRRGNRALRPSAKVEENNEQQEAARATELAKASSSANRKRKQSDTDALGGPKTSRRRVAFAAADRDGADDKPPSADEATETSTTTSVIDHIGIFKGRVCVMEEEEEERDSDDEDDEDDDEENDVPNEAKQKQSKMRGKRPTGGVKSRALATNFADSASINKNFPKYSDKTRYGQRNVPMALLDEYEDSLRKARCVTAWRRMSPSQQKNVCDQIATKIATRRQTNAALAKQLKENERKSKQAEKDAAKERKAQDKAAQKEANAEMRREKKREAAQKKRDEAKAKAAEVCAFCLCSLPFFFRLLTSPGIVVNIEPNQQQILESGGCGCSIIQSTAPQ
jgi:hypothetical protein